jgi:hypothetical protein
MITGNKLAVTQKLTDKTTRNFQMLETKYLERFYK